MIHHSTILEPDDRTTIEGIPATAVPRTLLDLAAGRRDRRLPNAVDQAERMDLLDLAKIDELLARSGRHRGRQRLRQALELHRDPVFSRARSERLFLALVKKAGLPPPAINTFVAGHEIDAYWDAEHFAVEIDGWSTHRTRASFERYRLRQEELKLAGIDSIRISARRLERAPARVAENLERLLAQRRNELKPIPLLRSGRI